MRLFNTTTRDNFKSYFPIDINSLKLPNYVHLLPAFKELNEMLGITSEEYLVACRELKFENRELFDIEYFNPDDYHCGVLVMPDAAVRERFDNNGNAYYVSYSAYAVSANYASEAESKLIRFFFENRYPEIFLHPEFTTEKTTELNVTDMTLAQIIAEYGNMTYREARYKLPLRTARKYVVRKSKFKFYPISNSRNEYEIYLEVNEKGDSLYIPVQAIIQKKYSLVKGRHTAYFMEYYKNYPDKLKNALKLLNTSEAKLLRKLLNS